MHLNSIQKEENEHASLLPKGAQPVSHSAIIYQYLIRSPKMIATRLLRTISLTSLFIMAALRFPELLPSIGIIATICGAISGIISAPAFGTNIITSQAFQKDKSGNITNDTQEKLQKILLSSFKMMSAFGGLATLASMLTAFILQHEKSNTSDDISIFLLYSSISPLLGAWYNSLQQYLTGQKKEGTVAKINIISSAVTLLLCSCLTFTAKLGIKAAAISYLSRSIINFSFILPFCWKELKGMFLVSTDDWGEEQRAKSKFITLHFATEFLLPVSISIIMRILGETPSSAYALFSFYKTLISVFMYGFSNATRNIALNYLAKTNQDVKNFTESSKIAIENAGKKTTARVAKIGAFLQLFCTGTGTVFIYYFGKNYLHMLTMLHEGKSKAAVEKAEEIMPLFTALMMVDSLRLLLSSTMNGRKNTKIPAQHSLLWVGILAQAACWIAGVAFHCSMETLAYISFAAFGLNIASLSVDLRAELKETRENEEESLMSSGSTFFKYCRRLMSCSPECWEPNNSNLIRI